MESKTAALRELHRIHRQLTDLREQLDRGPKQVRARSANVQLLEGELAAAKESTQSARMNVDRKQLDLKGGETKVQELKTKLNTCSNNKEYQALLDQIAAAEMAGSVLADEILEGLEEIDALEIRAGEADGKVATSRQELAKIEKEVAAQAAGLKSEIERLEAELKRAETELPADVRSDYDRVVKSKGEDALTAVDGEHCGGCHQSITPNMQNELHMGRAIFCRSCGRLLYLPEGRSARADS